MNFIRIAQNSCTLLSWSLRRDTFKPTQCAINKYFTKPKDPIGECDCIKYCKYDSRSGNAESYSCIQEIDNVVYSVSPLKIPIDTKETIVMYL